MKLWCDVLDFPRLLIINSLGCPENRICHWQHNHKVHSTAVMELLILSSSADGAALLSRNFRCLHFCFFFWALKDQRFLLDIYLCDLICQCGKNSGALQRYIMLFCFSFTFKVDGRRKNGSSLIKLLGYWFVQHSIWSKGQHRLLYD